MRPRDRLDEIRRAIDRDAAQVDKPQEHGSLLRSTAMIGSVGWPIAILAGGGAILGHFLDVRFASGVHATLGLLVGGAIAGSLIAARTVREGGAR